MQRSLRACSRCCRCCTRVEGSCSAAGVDSNAATRGHARSATWSSLSADVSPQQLNLGRGSDQGGGGQGQGWEGQAGISAGGSARVGRKVWLQEASAGDVQQVAAVGCGCDAACALAAGAADATPGLTRGAECRGGEAGLFVVRNLISGGGDAGLVAGGYTWGCPAGNATVGCGCDAACALAAGAADASPGLTRGAECRGGGAGLRLVDSLVGLVSLAW